MLRRVVLVRTDISVELGASIIIPFYRAYLAGYG
jgi:hypothetical protein